MNVMLSRCKKGMIICTSRRFIEGQAGKSLVGKLANTLGKKTWISARQVLREGIQPFV
jgi:regulator of nonsense transcripts 1